MKIKAIGRNSIAADLGLQPGDRLAKINGESIKDIIDYRFYIADEEVVLDVKKVDGSRQTIELAKEPDEDLGVEFHEPGYHRCSNKCIFCFIDQNPTGMRRSIYFRDDDIRLSFLYGNYVTLSHTREADIQRIIKQRLSPLYVSVHTTDPKLRLKMLGVKWASNVMELIDRLTKAGIVIHGQVVLCPGINDGDYLYRTVQDLAAYFPGVRSVAVVPLGLTRHRKGLTPLRKPDPEFARATLEMVTGWQSTLRRRIGRGFVYLGDEFYLMAGVPVPKAEEYDDFPQLENGIGMVRRFLNELTTQAPFFPSRLVPPQKVVLVTGLLAAPLLGETLVPRLRAIEGLDVELVAVENHFYGRAITVSGLLTGGDIITAVGRQDRTTRVILPPNCTNEAGQLLDDLSLEQASRALNTVLEVAPNWLPDLFQHSQQAVSTWPVND